MTQPEKPPERLPEAKVDLAAFWRVPVRTLHRIETGKSPAPTSDPAAMIAWYAALPINVQSRLTKALVARIEQIRMQLGGKGANDVDPDYAEFKAARATKGAKDLDALAELKKLRDFALFKIDKATAGTDFAALNAATNLLKHFSGIIHDEELRAQRLGREMGDLLPRAQAEAVARAIPYWLVVGIDALLAELAPLLVAASASGPLGHEDVRRLIEPALLSKRVLAPFARSAQIQTGVSLPRWMIEAMEQAMTDTLEDGAAEFKRLYGEPVEKS